MDKILYVERFVYASIIPFKDYCKLSQKNDDFNIINTNKVIEGSDGFFYTRGGNPFYSVNPKNANLFKLPLLKSNKKTTYFYTENENDSRYSLEYFSGDNKHIYHTNKDRQIKRHFARPFSSISIHTLERSIKKVDDKLIIKIYEGIKSRGVNLKYFKKKFITYTFSIDLVKGNFTTGTIQKNVKTFRKNSFFDLNRIFINSNIFSLSGKNSFIDKKNKLYNEYLSVIDDSKFFKCMMDNLKFENIGDLNHKFKNFNTNFIKFFIDKKKIKVPNGDYDFWLRNFYPTEKYLKKNDRKLLASILDMYGLKTKTTIKILHRYPNIDFESFVILCKLFGDEFSLYLGNINPLLFENSKKEVTVIQSKSMLLHQLEKDYDLNQKDKENLLKYLNNTIKFDTNVLTSNKLQLVVDHFNMINKIRVYDPLLHMKATNEKEFIEEHTELSKLVTAIKKGWVIEYQFNKKMLDEIEKPIKSYCICENVPHEKDFVLLYPKVLKREEEYIEEGNFMHHCVATYADQERSIIISLRNEDGSDRITCEYKIQDGKLVQSRHFCNGSVPEHFKDALEVLSDKVLIHARWGTLNWLEKKKVPVQINGIEIKKTEPTRFGDFLELEF